ncbi:thiamine pyrophosphate-dependent enzyme [Bordetella bronchiseptica]|uniref:thiamine pyrophosphate-dependent enzyme n=1 Tax=Bordetella bronchiseptica TaxID=518 RepID=UPI0002905CB2|nr:thiamine pyrophosphate-dependent enzyme [Bordetella bronchiseptica]KDC69545.1 thiamine pyrophosphate enzyme, C-terminal TPP binding domain protein [Bordetella bronchiseptica MBORD632]CCN21780.1 thiamine pyrophosphate enzyme-like tpp-binding [Bordetella bronchiseptica 1289]
MTISTNQACQAIHDVRGDAIVVATMSAMKEMDAIAPDAPLSLSSVPLMGGAAGLGLGLAQTRPERKVIVLDGDASLLMEMGVLATIGGASPRNLYHFVFANGVQFNGNYPLAIAGQGQVDFAEAARACGYRTALRIDCLATLEAGLGDILDGPGPVLVALAIEPSLPSLGPDNPGPEQPDKRFMRMGEEARALMAALGVQP